MLHWPGMSSEIEDLVLNYEVCAKYGRSNMKEPLIRHAIPSLPWSNTSHEIITFFKSQFARHGIPDIYPSWLVSVCIMCHQKKL